MKRALACLVVALFAVGCDNNGGRGGSPTDPSQVNVEFSFSDLTVGPGTEAGPGSRVTMLYDLWLYNPAGTESKGVRVGGSSDPNAGPFTFTVGTTGPGGAISGIDQGVRGMRQGGRRRIYIPPSMAYGSQGSAPAIPPNASLVFEVELTSVQ